MQIFIFNFFSFSLIIELVSVASLFAKPCCWVKASFTIINLFNS